jgi:hypothetical protein
MGHVGSVRWGLSASGGNDPLAACKNVFRGDGVHGEGGINGVSGRTSTATASGVYGQKDSTGFGVAGRAANCTGVFADSANGTALQVSGKAQFSRSGVVTITYPAKSAVVTGVPVTSKSFAFATIQKFLAGVYVVAAGAQPERIEQLIHDLPQHGSRQLDDSEVGDGGVVRD